MNNGNKKVRAVRLESLFGARNAGRAGFNLPNREKRNKEKCIFDEKSNLAIGQVKTCPPSNNLACRWQPYSSKKFPPLAKRIKKAWLSHIKVDEDDNKFVDCAIASNAIFIVSEDKHFKELEGVPFPKVEVIGIDSFLQYLQ